MKNYLVTGGCGFIGRHLVKALANKGHKVRILDDLSAAAPSPPPPGVELLTGSVTSPQDVAAALEGIEGCFHLAAITAVQRSIVEWGATHLVNAYGIVLLLEAIARLPAPIPLVYASSAAVYGNPVELPLKETSLKRPISPYGFDKLASEEHARLAWELFRIPSIGFRLFNVYGPGQNPSSSYAGVITRFLSQVLREEPVTLFGTGSQSRDFIYVEDVVALLLQGMEHLKEEAHVFNACTGIGTPIVELLHYIEEIHNKAAMRQVSPRREGDIDHSIGDPAHVVAMLGVTPSISLKEGLLRMARDN